MDFIYIIPSIKRVDEDLLFEVEINLDLTSLAVSKLDFQRIFM